MRLRDEYRRMRTAMEAAGYPVVTSGGGTKGKCASEEYWPRAVIAFYLYGGRWNNRRIGELMHRDHSTVTTMRKCVENALEFPRMYDDVNEMIERFKNKYHELYGSDL